MTDFRLDEGFLNGSTSWAARITGLFLALLILLMSTWFSLGVYRRNQGKIPVSFVLIGLLSMCYFVLHICRVFTSLEGSALGLLVFSTDAFLVIVATFHFLVVVLRMELFYGAISRRVSYSLTFTLRFMTIVLAVTALVIKGLLVFQPELLFGADPAAHSFFIQITPVLFLALGFLCITLVSNALNLRQIISNITSVVTMSSTRAHKTSLFALIGLGSLLCLSFFSVLFALVCVFVIEFAGTSEQQGLLYDASTIAANLLLPVCLALHISADMVYQNLVALYIGTINVAQESADSQSRRQLIRQSKTKSLLFGMNQSSKTKSVLFGADVSPPPPTKTHRQRDRQDKLDNSQKPKRTKSILKKDYKPRYVV